MEAVEADKTFYSVWHTKERAHRQAASKESLPTWYSSETFNPFADNNTARQPGLKPKTPKSQVAQS
eukprot:4780103-Prymnesium_polylepis.1